MKRSLNFGQGFLQAHSCMSMTSRTTMVDTGYSEPIRFGLGRSHFERNSEWSGGVLVTPTRSNEEKGQRPEIAPRICSRSANNGDLLKASTSESEKRVLPLNQLVVVRKPFRDCTLPLANVFSELN
jgi:hypothetical protein